MHKKSNPMALNLWAIGIRWKCQFRFTGKRNFMLRDKGIRHIMDEVKISKSIILGIMLGWQNLRLPRLFRSGQALCTTGESPKRIKKCSYWPQLKTCKERLLRTRILEENNHKNQAHQTCDSNRPILGRSTTSKMYWQKASMAMMWTRRPRTTWTARWKAVNPIQVSSSTLTAKISRITSLDKALDNRNIINNAQQARSSK